MSFDPYGPDADRTRPIDPTAPVDYPPDQGRRPVENGAGGRVQVPGILMIVLAVLNLLPTAFALFTFVSLLTVDPDEFARRHRMGMEAMKKIMPGAAAELDKQAQNPEAARSSGMMMYGGASGFGLFGSLLVLVGGIQMLRMRTYALCVLASVFVAIPCITGCCLVGQGVGIWALVMLLDGDVRSAFR